MGVFRRKGRGVQDVVAGWALRTCWVKGRREDRAALGPCRGTGAQGAVIRPLAGRTPAVPHPHPHPRTLPTVTLPQLGDPPAPQGCSPDIPRGSRRAGSPPDRPPPACLTPYLPAQGQPLPRLSPTPASGEEMPQECLPPCPQGHPSLRQKSEGRQSPLTHTLWAPGATPGTSHAPPSPVGRQVLGGGSSSGPCPSGRRPLPSQWID